MFVFCIHVVFLSQCFVKHFLFFSSFLLFISLLRLLLISLLLSSQHSYFLSLMIIFVNILLILFPPSLSLHPFLFPLSSWFSSSLSFFHIYVMSLTLKLAVQPVNFPNSCPFKYLISECKLIHFFYSLMRW